DRPALAPPVLIAPSVGAGSTSGCTTRAPSAAEGSILPGGPGAGARHASCPNPTSERRTFRRRTARCMSIRRKEYVMSHEHGTVIDTLRQRLLARRRAIVGRVARTDDLLDELEESTPAEIEEDAQELNQARIVAELGQRGRAELDAIDGAIAL